MSVHDELTSVQRCLDDLMRSVGRLEKQLGSGGLEMRRVRTDTDHLRESVALLRETAAGPAGAPPRPDLVTISDTPYDPSLWIDTDDEGLGARDRRAPCPGHRRAPRPAGPPSPTRPPRPPRPPQSCPPTAATRRPLPERTRGHWYGTSRHRTPSPPRRRTN